MNCVGDYSVIVSRTANFIFKDEWLLNTEKDHIDEPSNMFELLEEFDINKKKTANYSGRFSFFRLKIRCIGWESYHKEKSL